MITDEREPYEFPPIKFPPAVDLRPWMTRVEQQSRMGACGANAFAGALEYLYKRYSNKDVDVSRLFMYYNSRMIEYNETKVPDKGSSKTYIVKSLRQFGICKESVWPYEDNLINTKPPSTVYEMANKVTVLSMSIPQKLIAMKTCLANQFPFVIGIKLMPPIEQATINNGYISLPNSSDPQVKSQQSHAVLIVGYNDKDQHFIVRNSWGHQWGDQGYCYVPYSYLLDRNLTNWKDGLWVILQIYPRTSLHPPLYELVVQKYNKKKINQDKHEPKKVSWGNIRHD